MIGWCCPSPKTVPLTQSALTCRTLRRKTVILRPRRSRWSLTVLVSRLLIWRRRIWSSAGPVRTPALMGWFLLGVCRIWVPVRDCLSLPSTDGRFGASEPDASGPSPRGTRLVVNNPIAGIEALELMTEAAEIRRAAVCSQDGCRSVGRSRRGHSAESAVGAGTDAVVGFSGHSRCWGQVGVWGSHLCTGSVPVGPDLDAVLDQRGSRSARSDHLARDLPLHP